MGSTNPRRLVLTLLRFCLGNICSYTARYGSPCSCRGGITAITASTAWDPIGRWTCRATRSNGSNLPPCPRPVAGGADTAGSPGAGWIVPRRGASERWHGPAWASASASARAGPTSRSCFGRIRSLLTRRKPGPGFDESAAFPAGRSVVSGALVRGGRSSRAWFRCSGRARGRSRPSRPRPSPWIGRPLAKRCCNTARDRRSRLSGSRHTSATRRCQKARRPGTGALFDPARARWRKSVRLRWPRATGQDRGLARPLGSALQREDLELVGARARSRSAQLPPA
jgi:hypothetical protein